MLDRDIASPLAQFRSGAKRAGLRLMACPLQQSTPLLAEFRSEAVRTTVCPVRRATPAGPLHNRTSITCAPRPRARRPMASVSGSTRPMLNEFYRVAFRKKVYRSIDELQADLAMCGSRNTMSRGLIKDAGALERPRCKPSWMQCRWRRKR